MPALVLSWNCIDSQMFGSLADSLEVSQSLLVIVDLDSDDGLDLIKESLLSLICLYIFYFLVLSNA